MKSKDWYVFQIGDEKQKGSYRFVIVFGEYGHLADKVVGLLDQGEYIHSDCNLADVLGGEVVVMETGQ